MTIKETYKLISLLLLTIVNTLFSQTYNFKNYNTEQGLPQSQVLTIFQDHSGNMWFGTNSGGAGKFNGNKFTTISDNEGLINNAVYSIIENDKNEIVFGTSKGISVFNGFKFKNYNEKQGLTNSWIFKLLQDGDKTWIGTQEGVYILQNEKIRRFNFDKTLNTAAVFSIFIDSKKRLWFGTINNGAICYDPENNTFKNYNKTNGLQENLVFSFVENKEKEILIGTSGGVNIINAKNEIRNCDYIPLQFNVAFRSMLNSSKNEEWYGTADIGLYRFSNNILKKFNPLNGLTNSSIMCLFEDRENNIWLGTDGSGVYKFLGEQFTSYTTKNGLTDNYINATAQDINGAYWVALRNSGIAKIEGTKITSYKFNKANINAIPDNDILTILPLADGRLFLGTRDGLCIYENGIFKTFSDYDFRHKYILSLFQDSKKNIWIGTNDGLFKFTNGVITSIYNVNALKQSEIPFPIFCLSEDKFGAIWIGTENGVVKLDNNSITMFSDKNNFTKKRILTIVKDKNQNLWFGTEEGLFNYDNSNFTKISQKNGLTSNFINFLQLDNLNRLLIGANTGIDILNLNDFYKSKISIKHFGIEDGLLNLESNYNSSSIDKDGRILIGTIYGLEIYNPAFDKINKQEAITNINFVKLFFGQEDISKYSTGIDSASFLPKNLKLPFNKNHLTFQFIGISLSAPEKVMYQYKLEGLDDDWTPPTSRTEATYSSLPPGAYKFMLKAMNNDGLWNDEPLTYEFIISPPWYNTWWFYTLCVILLIGGIWLYNFIHTKNLIADKQKLETQVTERTKELRDGMDITLCAFNNNSNEIQYAGANRPLWIYRKDKNYELEIIKATKYPIGGLELEENRIYENHTVQVNQGDCLYLFSDGYADQFGGPKGKKFMVTNLQKLLLENVVNPMDTQQQNLTKAFTDWKSDAEQIDDVLVIGIKI